MSRVATVDETTLTELHREGAARWPGVSLDRAHFATMLEAAPDATHAVDLYLAGACLARDPHAIEAFEREIMQGVRASVQRACRQNALSEDEVMQSTSAKLLAGPPEPRLRQYTGKGPLMGWVRVVAVREALKSARKTSRERPVDDTEMLGAVTSTASVELRLLERMHAGQFAQSVREAMRRLSVDQRAILRFHLHDALTIDQIAPMLGIHRATGARRLEKARADILSHTQDVLRERHGLSESEVRSLCVALGGEVDISFSRALGEGEEAL